MDNITLTYRILKAVDDSSAFSEFDGDMLTPDYLGAPSEQINAALLMLAKDGYICGIEVKEYVFGSAVITNRPRIRLTTAGVEYYQYSPAMRTESDKAKGVIRRIV